MKNFNKSDLKPWLATLPEESTLSRMLINWPENYSKFLMKNVLDLKEKAVSDFEESWTAVNSAFNNRKPYEDQRISKELFKKAFLVVMSRNTSWKLPKNVRI